MRNSNSSESWQTLLLLASISLPILLTVNGNSLREGAEKSRSNWAARKALEYDSSEIENLAGFEDAPAGTRPKFHFPLPVFRDSKEYQQGWPWNLSRNGRKDKTTTPSTGTAATIKAIVLDDKGRVKMGVNSNDCDDAKTKLEMDWDGSPANYTCFHPESPYPEDTSLLPIRECVTLPKEYLPQHFCMKDHIYYDHPIPSYGDHRPLWPKFGEYIFVPPQRWLHNIEHGAVVMLYHPCTHPSEVARLKKILRECNGKHVITPSTLLPKERPLALVSWGCRYLMSVVDAPSAIKFIAETSFHGPEGNYTKEGQYDFGLVRLANETAGARYDKITCDIPRA